MKFIWFDKFVFKKNHEGTTRSFRIFKKGGSESSKGEKILQPEKPQIRDVWLTRRTSFAIRHRIMRDHFFF